MAHKQIKSTRSLETFPQTPRWGIDKTERLAILDIYNVTIKLDLASLNLFLSKGERVKTRLAVLDAEVSKTK